MQPNDHTEAGERRERFMQLLMPLYKRLEDFAFAMARDREEACDLVAETVLRAFESFDRLKDDRAFLGYLFTIASREFRHRRRRGKWFAGYDSDVAEAVRCEGTAPDVHADVEFLYQALAMLPHEQREAVALFEISGFSIKEIAEIQGGTIAAVKVRLFRARRRLAKLLGVDGSPDASDSGRSRGREERPDESGSGLIPCEANASRVTS